MIAGLQLHVAPSFFVVWRPRPPKKKKKLLVLFYQTPNTDSLSAGVIYELVIYSVGILENTRRIQAIPTIQGGSWSIQGDSRSIPGRFQVDSSSIPGRFQGDFRPI